MCHDLDHRGTNNSFQVASVSRAQRWDVHGLGGRGRSWGDLHPPQRRDSNRSALQKSVLAALYSSEGSVMEVRCVPPQTSPCPAPRGSGCVAASLPAPCLLPRPRLLPQRHHFAQAIAILNSQGCNIFDHFSRKVGPRSWHLSHATLPARAGSPHPFWTPSSPSLDPALGMQGLAGSAELITPALLPGPAGLPAHAGPHEGHHLGHRPGPPPAHLQGPPEDGRR